MNPININMAYDVTKEDLDHFEDYYQGQWVDILEKIQIENQISIQNQKEEKNRDKEMEIKETKSKAKENAKNSN